MDETIVVKLLFEICHSSIKSVFIITSSCVRSLWPLSGFSINPRAPSDLTISIWGIDDESMITGMLLICGF